MAVFKFFPEEIYYYVPGVTGLWIVAKALYIYLSRFICPTSLKGQHLFQA